MRMTEHFAKHHINRLLNRIEGKEQFRKHFKKLKEEFDAEEAVKLILQDPDLFEILNDCVEYRRFGLYKLETDKEFHKLTLDIRGLGGKTYDIYDLHFVTHYEGFDKRIENLKKEIHRIDSENTLFDDNKKQDITNLRQEFEAVEVDKRVFLENNKPFNAEAWTVKFENKGGLKRITFKVPVEMALKVTEKNFTVAENYRVVLNPLTFAESSKGSK